MRFGRIWGLCWGLGLVLGACSYAPRRQEFRLGTMSGFGDTGREEWRLFIPVVDNMTAETGFEPEVTAALRRVLGSIRGLRLVTSESEADLILLGRIYGLGRKRGDWSAHGTAATQASGGLEAGKFRAQNVFLDLSLEATLYRKLGPNEPVKERLWTRQFQSAARYDTSARVYESGRFEAAGGSSSGIFVERSREQILLQTISQNIAQSVVDQVVQDF